MNRLRPWLRGAFWTLAALAATAPIRAQQAQDTSPLAYGPARFVNQFLPSIGYLALEPDSAILLPADEWQLEFTFSASNTFAQSDKVQDELRTRTERRALTLEEFRAFPVAEGDDGVFHIDEETHYAAFKARRTFGDRYQGAVTLPLVSLGGGRLDGEIESFHNSTGYDQDGRLGVPKDGVRVYLSSADYELFYDHTIGFELGDVSFSLIRRLGPAHPHNSWAVEGKVKLPTGKIDSFAGTGSPDLGLRLLHTRRYRWVRLDAGVGVLALGKQNLLRLPSQQIRAGFASCEVRFGARTSGFFQAEASTTPFEAIHLDEMARLAVGWMVGTKHVLFDKSVLVAAISENIASYDNSPDVGVHVSVSYNFD
jgi:Protein of unknown function (DUF3187)